MLSPHRERELEQNQDTVRKDEGTKDASISPPSPTRSSAQESAPTSRAASTLELIAASLVQQAKEFMAKVGMQTYMQNRQVGARVGGERGRGGIEKGNGVSEYLARPAASGIDCVRRTTARVSLLLGKLHRRQWYCL